MTQSGRQSLSGASDLLCVIHLIRVSIRGVSIASQLRSIQNVSLNFTIVKKYIGSMESLWTVLSTNFLRINPFWTTSLFWKTESHIQKASQGVMVYCTSNTKNERYFERIHPKNYWPQNDTRKSNQQSLLHRASCFLQLSFVATRSCPGYNAVFRCSTLHYTKDALSTTFVIFMKYRIHKLADFSAVLHIFW